MRRIALLLSLAVLAATATAGAQPPPVRSWAAPQIETVVAAGLMAPSVTDFRPDDLLTSSELATALSSLGAEATVADDPFRLVTVRELDAQLVTIAGLRPQARELRLAAERAGLMPRPWLGTETAARMLGLRINHLQAADARELQVSQPVTRAEAAYSIARVLTIQQYELDSVRLALDTFMFEQLSVWQQNVLRRALRLVGSPYVWAGTSERPQPLFGRTLPGGFDCSGFVWRVYKLEPFAGAPALSASAQGKDDLRHERRGSALSAHHSLEPPTRRRRLLRRERHALEAERGRAHGHLRRLGLDGALVRPRHDAHADDGLVRDALRLGPPPARRSRPGVELHI